MLWKSSYYNNDELHGWNVPQRVQYKLGVMVHRCLQGMAPQYLIDCCIPTSDIASRQRLWSATRHRCSRFGRRAFSVAARCKIRLQPWWQVRWSGTCCCLIISVIHRSASDFFD